MKVGIIGKTNVGKSTLFNRIIGERKIIVHKTSGTTIDRIEHNVLWKDKNFTIVDTAGLIDISDITINNLTSFIKEFDLLLLVMDAKNEISYIELKIVKQIRKIFNKKIILVINKTDKQEDKFKNYEFYSLGLKDIVFISAEHGKNINTLLDKIINNIHDKITNVKPFLKIVFVGQTNVGKSSCINAILSSPYCKVSNIPDTTRDAIEVLACNNKKTYKLIDTAGLIGKKKVKNKIKYLSIISTIHAIKDSDIAILIIDASKYHISETDVKIIELLYKIKPVILAINKWDLIIKKKDVANDFKKQINNKLKFINWIKMIFISSKTKYGLRKIFMEADNAFLQYSRKLSQKELNIAMTDFISKNPYHKNGKFLKIISCIQKTTKPPIFIFFVNDVKLIHFSYKRFLENSIRYTFKFYNTPIILKFKRYYGK